MSDSTDPRPNPTPDLEKAAEENKQQTEELSAADLEQVAGGTAVNAPEELKAALSSKDLAAAGQAPTSGWNISENKAS